VLIWPKDKLTRFEVARLVGARALQIALGAPVLVETEKTNSIEIAKEEFKKKIIPITIKRKMPDGTEVVVDVKTGIENWIADHKGEI
jgi:DNA-directed RNA polymerase subunit K